MAIEYKGGECQICGYKKHQGALELHHTNQNEKSFGIGDKGYTRAWETVKAELDKCILLCANCHREVGAGIQQLPEEIQVVNEVNSGEPFLKGNPEPSLDLYIRMQEGVETIPNGSTFRWVSDGKPLAPDSILF